MTREREHKQEALLVDRKTGSSADENEFAEPDLLWTDESGEARTEWEEKRAFCVETGGERLDRYLAEAGAWSRAFIQTLIDRGLVLVDGRSAKASKKLTAGSAIEVMVPAAEPIDVEPENIPLDIFYEDAELLVVNKPRGMVVHPAPGHTRGTLVGALLGRVGGLSQIGGAIRPGIVHRIDKDTSGLLVVAKTDAAHHGLSEQFREHSVTRVYRAIVHGVVSPDSGTVDAPIDRDPHKRQRMAVVAEGEGRRAVTHFWVTERFRTFSFLELRLETGRTHQIRVHLAYIGHPLAGDPVYATRDPLGLQGQALHAATLGFDHPLTGERLTFHTPLPEWMERALAGLRADRDA